MKNKRGKYKKRDIINIDTCIYLLRFSGISTALNCFIISFFSSEERIDKDMIIMGLIFFIACELKIHDPDEEQRGKAISIMMVFIWLIITFSLGMIFKVKLLIIPVLLELLFLWFVFKRN